MRVVKKINNNIALCIDNAGHELIAFGKGIGFPQTPYELNDMSKIWRTFYGVNPEYYRLFNEIPESLFKISIQIVDYAKMTIRNEINPNVVFTLVDHIHFAVDRYNKKMDIKMPFVYDIQYLYEEELKVGQYAVKCINQQLNIHLPKEEAMSIALHFINAENRCKTSENGLNQEEIIEDITAMIEKNFDMVINREGFNYSRFLSHIEYMIRRFEKQTKASSENKQMFESMKQTFEKTYLCVTDIQNYLLEKCHWHLNEEELLYLMMHINRLCNREDSQN